LPPAPPPDLAGEVVEEPWIDEGDEDRNFAPEVEDERRRTHLFRLGLVMALAFFAPIVGVPGHPFVIPELSSEVGVFGGPALLVAVRLLPLLAGVMLMLVARRADQPLRGCAITGAGGLLFGLFVIDGRARSAIADSFSLLPNSFSLSLLLLLAGVGGMLVAVRTRWYRPGSQPAAWIGAIAGGCYLLYLVVPSSSVLPIGALLDTFRSSILAGLASVAHLGCMVGAAVLCLRNTGATPSFLAVGRARLACRLLLAAVLVPGAVILLAIMTSPGSGQIIAPLVSSALKYGVMFGGLLLLIPVGITDLLVGRPDAN